MTREDSAMGFDLSTVRFTRYGPDRFPAWTPFATRGYLFTVPGDYPVGLPDFLHVTNSEMAVYRTRASGTQMWEVRDANGNRRVWGEDTTRRGAVGLALAEIARKRRENADEIRDRRVNLLGPGARTAVPRRDQRRCGTRPQPRRSRTSHPH
ncbi:hypothetical protein [Streptomyces sulphureus]|uniref:hypothetical protein n=1 Tax=Streptomyces sulphureus TaxID=47758 RepID=UPI00131A1081|nr:hypothetical protein [Streptomyces sulphureus]